jgi:membrane protein DedA with SNARE-associated domain
MILSMISLLVGALLGQRFKVMVLMPATAILLILAVGIGVTHAQTAWSIVLMAAAAATSMQIGYLIGIGIHHVLAAAWSSRSSPRASPTASARHHPAHY